jgi:hypothetical protein
MSYPINYPTPQGANVQIFTANTDDAADGFSGDWVKPQGASMVWFTLIGAGGGGGNAITDASGGNAYAGGGGSGNHTATPRNNDGGLGGGGSATYYGGNNATYYGGGGGGGGANWGNGGNGFEGVVIIRYLTPTSSSTIELLRGTTTDANHDWKLGNYNGDFIIKKSVDNVETDTLIIYKDQLIGRDLFLIPDGDLNVAGTIYTGALSATNNISALGSISGSSLTTSGNLISYGRTGIGMNAPTSFTLEVALGSGGTGGGTYGYLGNTASVVNQYVANFNEISVKINGRIWATNLLISSDSRIKEDIQDINDDSALQSILAIEPKTYKYVDKVIRGHNRVYGFIAQQIREVIPEAVSIQASYIPNIMLLADYDNNVITLPLLPNLIIKSGDKIKCYDKDNNEVFMEVVEEVVEEVIIPLNSSNVFTEVVEEVIIPLNSSNVFAEVVEEVVEERSVLRFRIKPLETPYTDNKIFVYGTEIDDFHTLNKDYIFTLNVCATQELHRRIISQDERIKELEEKVERLLNNISL